MTGKVDIFLDHRVVHVKMDKDVHARLRGKLIAHSVTMQDFFNELARMFANDDPKLDRVVEALVVRRVKAEIDGKQPRLRPATNEIDAEALYGLISAAPSGSGGKEDDETAG